MTGEIFKLQSLMYNNIVIQTIKTKIKNFLPSNIAHKLFCTYDDKIKTTIE